MLFRRRRRRPPPDLSSLERSLDLLAELVERLVALLPDLVGTRPPPVAAAPAATEPVANPAREPPRGHVLFVGRPAGYVLLEREGAPPPAAGAVVELDHAPYVVLRLGPSPLPGDGRRCAFLERQQRPSSERAVGA
jgi:hypothetical protein